MHTDVLTPAASKLFTGLWVFKDSFYLSGGTGVIFCRQRQIMVPCIRQRQGYALHVTNLQSVTSQTIA